MYPIIIVLLTHSSFVTFFCRSRLAAASVLLPSSEGLDQEVQRDVIQLLCSIFLANQGEHEGAGEDKQFVLVGSIFQIFHRNLGLTMFKILYLIY